MNKEASRPNSKENIHHSHMRTLVAVAVSTPVLPQPTERIFGAENLVAGMEEWNVGPSMEQDELLVSLSLSLHYSIHSALNTKRHECYNMSVQYQKRK